MANVAMMVDTSLCIGCKACEVACKQWNQLPADGLRWTGNSYDNTVELSATTYRHVKFIEQFSEDRSQGRWLFMSDACKHCAEASCLEVCPTGALHRTEFGTVDIHQGVCNGCRYCISACPFGVIDFNQTTGRVNKCTFCSDRLEAGMVPACAKACPTDSLVFGTYGQLIEKGRQRTQQLKTRGESKANLYGDQDVLGGLGMFYVLLDKPSIYGLPDKPELSTSRVWGASLFSAAGAVALGVLTALSFRARRMARIAAGEEE